MFDIILVRYGEMTLKKRNYKQFQDKVNQNIKNKCKKFPNLTYSQTSYRFYIHLNGENHIDVINALNTVVGLSSYSLCRKVNPNYDDIAQEAIQLINSVKKQDFLKFKVETNRGNKDFPATSIEISQEVAKRILPNINGLLVDVRNPELILNIDLRSEGTFIFIDSIPGLGGFPSGMAGKGLLMISGGIDSPVAGFLTLRKGVNLELLHFASPPFTSDLSLQKVIDLSEILANYTVDGKIKLLVCPFTKIQESIYHNADSSYLVTIMRRQMYKIAEEICRRRNVDIIVNGESIGQVASQTLESIRVVNEVTNIPIIRPLATYDKEEIIHIARKIETLDISTRPYEDCCTVFVPDNPIIKPKIDRVKHEENKCNLDALILEAVDNIEEINLNYFSKYSIFEIKNKEKFEI